MIHVALQKSGTQLSGLLCDRRDQNKMNHTEAKVQRFK